MNFGFGIWDFGFRGVAREDFIYDKKKDEIRNPKSKILYVAGEAT